MNQPDDAPPRGDNNPDDADDDSAADDSADGEDANNHANVLDFAAAAAEGSTDLSGSVEIRDRPLGVPNLVGKRFGKYQVKRVVGHGAFGVVFEAIYTTIGRRVALKLPRPGVMIDTDRAPRFQGEATAAGLIDHPGIVTVYEAVFDAEYPYIASAFVEGPDLKRWLDEAPAPPSPADAAAFARQLVDAVAAAHRAGVIHRDLKPGNVLMAPCIDPETLAEYAPRLTDFGLAKIAEQVNAETRPSLLIGTPVYMAPERLEAGVPGGPAADIYSMGVLLYELLTLSPPFDGSTYVEVLDKLRNEQPAPPSHLNPETPRELDTICLRCLEKRPEDRYAAAEDLAEDLRRFVAGEPILARPLGLRERMLRWMSQPERISHAARWTVLWNSMHITWTFGTALLARGVGGIDGADLRAILAWWAVSAVFQFAPMIVLGFAVGQRVRGSFWLAAAGSLLSLVVYLNNEFRPAMTGDAESSLVRLGVFTGIVQGHLFQLVLYLLAAPAWGRVRRAARSEEGPVEAESTDDTGNALAALRAKHSPKRSRPTQTDRRADTDALRRPRRTAD